MKKNVFHFIGLFLTFSTFAFTQNQIARDEAYKVLKRRLLVDTLSNNVSVSKQIVPPKTILKFMDDSITSPENNNWFFLIDKEPFSDWTHPCIYIFVNAIDTSLTIIDGQKGASFPTDIILQQDIPDEYKLQMPIFNNYQQQVPIQNDNAPQKVAPFAITNYAILISGGHDVYNNNLRYWNNCSYVYKTLIEKGYKPSNIYVCSSDGTDNRDDLNYYSNGIKLFKTQNLDLDGNGIDDIAYSATKADISIVFDEVKTKIETDNNSNVLIYVTDHGGQVGTSNDVFLYLWGETMIPDTFFVQTKKLVSASFVEIVMDQCHSGGFADKFTQTGAIITTSCAYNETGKSYTDMYGIFLINWLSAIRGKDVLNNTDISKSVDINKDGYLDFSEAANYAKEKVKTLSMTPQYIANPGVLGHHITIDEIKPEAYCNNGKQDNGETGIDCGGSCVNHCVTVISGSGAASCFDGVKNKDETDIDCGGSCLPCSFEKKPVSVLSINECQCGNANLLSTDLTSPSLFSGLNILNSNNIKLSHGNFRHQFSYSYWIDKPSYRMISVPVVCGVRGTNCETEESILNGGLIFEENNVQFVPYKKYVLKFNYWYKSSKGIQFSLVNGLTNTFNNMETSYAKFAMEYIHSHTYFTYESSTDILPQTSRLFNIGQIGQISPPNVCSDNIDINNYSSYVNYPRRPYFADYSYAEVSLIFIPDNYYNQLWVVGNNVFFNSLKIEEYCITDIVYNANNTNISNPTKVANSITLESIQYEPTTSVDFVAGESITLKNNVHITPKAGGSVHLYVDTNVCSNNGKQSVKTNKAHSEDIIASQHVSPINIIPSNYTATNIKIKLYPNPTDGEICINNQNQEIYAVAIYDFSGKLVKEVPKCNGTTNISMSGFPKGIYAFKISSSTLQFFEKVIKR